MQGVSEVHSAALKTSIASTVSVNGYNKEPPKKIKTWPTPNSRCVCTTHCEILHDDKLRARRHFCWLLQGGSHADFRHVEKFTFIYKMTVIKKESERQSDFSQKNWPIAIFVETCFGRKLIIWWILLAFPCNMCQRPRLIVALKGEQLHINILLDNQPFYQKDIFSVKIFFSPNLPAGCHKLCSVFAPMVQSPTE